ncbi:MAG: lactonase family protein [Pirellulales bacterium]
MKCLISNLMLLFLTPAAVAGDFVYISIAGENRIAIYSQNIDDGSLTKVGDAKLEGAPGSLCVDPKRQVLFASVRSKGQLASFRINPRSGKLTAINAVSAGGNSAYVLTDNSGRYLLSAYYGEGKIAVHGVNADGRIEDAAIQSVVTDRNAHAVRLDASNRFVFVPHTGPNAIFQFVLDAKTGKLTANDPPKVVAPAGAGPRHIWFHPKLDMAYTSNEKGSSVTAYQFDKSSGRLTAIQTLSTLPEGFSDRNTTADVEVTPSGRFVYVSNRGHDSIAGFAIGTEKGGLTSIGQFATEKTPRSFNIDPAGKFLYAAGQKTTKLAAYRIDTDTGVLTRFATYEVGPRPSWVQVVTTR